MVMGPSESWPVLDQGREGLPGESGEEQGPAPPLSEIGAGMGEMVTSTYNFLRPLWDTAAQAVEDLFIETRQRKKRTYFSDS